MSKKNKTVPATTGNNGGAKQMGLTLFGSGLSDTLNRALYRDRVQEPATTYKDKKGKTRKKGEIDKTVFRIKPRVSAKNPDNLKSVFDCTGQELMGFEAVARQELSEMVLKRLSQGIMSGELGVQRGTVNHRTGAESYSFKRVGVKVLRTITKEEALRALNMTEEDLQQVIEQHEKEIAREEKIAA